MPDRRVRDFILFKRSTRTAMFIHLLHNPIVYCAITWVIQVRCNYTPFHSKCWTFTGPTFSTLQCGHMNRMAAKLAPKSTSLRQTSERAFTLASTILHYQVQQEQLTYKHTNVSSVTECFLGRVTLWLWWWNIPSLNLLFFLCHVSESCFVNTLNAPLFSSKWSNPTWSGMFKIKVLEAWMGVYKVLQNSWIMVETQRNTNTVNECPKERRKDLISPSSSNFS